MKTQTDKTQEPQKETVQRVQQESSTGGEAMISDNRPTIIAQRKLRSAMGSADDTKTPIQRKNNTGLPDNLKSGIENLSGYSMDDVKVHYNSSKPAQLQAHAYAQGTDIHLAPGQQKHLPHEAWHVVQQKQGRVKPTRQLKSKVNINDDDGLEKEADVMGSKALNQGTNFRDRNLDHHGLQGKLTIQKKEKEEASEETTGLDKAKADILGSAGTAENLLKTNKRVQAELMKNYNKSELFSHFTSMGIEVEFAQQSNIEWRKKRLTQEHIILASAPGFSYWDGIPFVLESDASRALEFVTAPLLAPLNDENQIGIPNFDWVKEATLKLEYHLKGMVDNPENKTIERITNDIKDAYGLDLGLTGEGDQYKDVEYNWIRKGQWRQNKQTGKWKKYKFRSGGFAHTNAQVNFMTTLSNYKNLNQKKPDESTERIFQLLMSGEADIMGVVDRTRAEYLNISESRKPSEDVYFAVAQKFREIPSIYIDMIMSELITNDKYKRKEYEKGTEPRSPLSNAASKIKDHSVFWLKTSLNQILKSYDTRLAKKIIDNIRSKKGQILKALQNTKEYKDLQEFGIEKKNIDSFINDRLKDITNAYVILRRKERKIEEQKTISSDRKRIIGARPDTYAPTQKNEANDDGSLFLVESRNTTSYLGITSKDRYIPKEIEAQYKREKKKKV